MAKCIIEITDLDQGKVEVKATPNFETMMKMEISGNKLTGAHGYALACLNHIRKISEQKTSSNIIKIPKVRKF